MSFDPSSLLDVSHLVTFLAGVAVACGGQYMADLFTDKRREKEGTASEKKQFRELRKVMPALFAEMKQDIEGDKSASVREFVLLPNERVMFNSGKKRFVYFANVHDDLQVKVERLLHAGFLTDETPSSGVPIFRMQESFVRLLMARRRWPFS